jgi:hypothetical protein
MTDHPRLRTQAAPFAAGALFESSLLLSPDYATSQVGLGHTVALHCRSSALYQTQTHIRCLFF